MHRNISGENPQISRKGLHDRQAIALGKRWEDERAGMAVGVFQFRVVEIGDVQDGVAPGRVVAQGVHDQLAFPADQAGEEKPRIRCFGAHPVDGLQKQRLIFSRLDRADGQVGRGGAAMQEVDE